MSKCNHVKKKISRYIDNDLNDFERRWLENHIVSCEECTLVYSVYKSMKDHVRNAYVNNIVEKTLPPSAQYKAKTIKQKIFLIWNAGTRLAAMIIIGISLCTEVFIFTLNKHNKQATLVIENESCLMMNAPLGALVYYQELAGRTIHAQYFQPINETGTTSVNESNTNRLKISGYNSPLFCDSHVYLLE